MKDRTTALAAGFLSGPLTFAGMELRPLTAGSMLILQELKNPLFGAELPESGEVPDDDDEDATGALLAILEFVWIHTAPVEEVIAVADGGEEGRKRVRQIARKLSLEYSLEEIVAFGEQFGGLKERIEAAMTTEAGGDDDEGKPKTGRSGLPAWSSRSEDTHPPGESAGSSGGSPSSEPCSISTPSSVPPVGSGSGASPATELPPHVIPLPCSPLPEANG